MAPIPISGIDHVALVVRDIDATLPWFTDQLGFALIGDELTPASGGARLAFLDAGNITIQLVSPTTTSGPIAEHLALHGEGLHHICFAVDDLDGMLERCRAAGLRLIDETPRIGAEGTRIAFLHPKSTGGILIELTEYGSRTAD